MVVLLLLAPGTRLSGFYLSTLLILGFTTYIGLVLTGFFDRCPCSCGGVISSMSFESHFSFNLLFLTLPALGAYLDGKQGPDRQHHQAASGTGGSLPRMRQE